MDEKNLTKIDYEDKDLKISLEKSNISELEEDNEDGWIISPTVGTYLDRDNPLKVGQKVKKNEVLFIINSMKVLNNIVAPRDGIISALPVEEGSYVASAGSVATVTDYSEMKIAVKKFIEKDNNRGDAGKR